MKDVIRVVIPVPFMSLNDGVNPEDKESENWSSSAGLRSPVS